MASPVTGETMAAFARVARGSPAVGEGGHGLTRQGHRELGEGREALAGQLFDFNSN